jgi:hypothetical protein
LVSYVAGCRQERATRNPCILAEWLEYAQHAEENGNRPDAGAFPVGFEVALFYSFAEHAKGDGEKAEGAHG